MVCCLSNVHVWYASVTAEFSSWSWHRKSIQWVVTAINVNNNCKLCRNAVSNWGLCNKMTSAAAFKHQSNSLYAHGRFAARKSCITWMYVTAANENEWVACARSRWSKIPIHSCRSHATPLELMIYLCLHMPNMSFDYSVTCRSRKVCHSTADMLPYQIVLLLRFCYLEYREKKDT